MFNSTAAETESAAPAAFACEDPGPFERQVVAMAGGIRSRGAAFLVEMPLSERLFSRRSAGRDAAADDQETKEAREKKACASISANLATGPRLVGEAQPKGAAVATHHLADRQEVDMSSHATLRPRPDQCCLARAPSNRVRGKEGFPGRPEARLSSQAIAPAALNSRFGRFRIAHVRQRLAVVRSFPRKHFAQTTRMRSLMREEVPKTSSRPDNRNQGQPVAFCTPHKPTTAAPAAVRRLARLFPVALAVACAFGALGANAALASGDLPTIRSENAGNITETSALLDICVSANGSDTNIVYSYGPTLEYGAEVEPVGGTISGEQNTAECEPVVLIGLKPGTLYYFEAQATNGAGTVTSANATFRTTPGVLPITEDVTGGTASDMTFSPSATYTYLEPMGFSTPSSHFEEGMTFQASTEIGPTVTQTETLSAFSLTDKNSSSSDPVMARLLANGVGDGPTCSVEGGGTCSSNTSETMTVHPGDHLAILVEDVGTGPMPLGPWGPDQVEATFSYHVDNLLSPELVEVATSTVTPTETEVSAQVAPEGTNTLYHIEYGLAVPGELNAPVKDIEVGNSLQPALKSLKTRTFAASAGQQRRVTQTLTGLSPGQTYYYRVVAMNAGGTTTSPEWTFQANGASTRPRSGSSSGGGTGNEGSSAGGNHPHDQGSVPVPPAAGKAVAMVSRSQIGALLRRQLIARHNSATVARLLRSGSVLVAFRAPVAGRATLDWYELPAGATLASRPRSKPVLVASAQMTFRTPAIGKLRLRLTAAGRRLLEHAKRFSLTAEGTFTPVGDAPVTRTNSFSLRR